MSVVHLVGAGPGDPGLLTVRGRDVLAAADVVLADRLVAPELLALVRPGAEVVYVGKAPGSHCASQDEINAQLVEHARAGRRVVRLKGGDPFVFGRGGEEALACAAAGVPWEVVPGVSSAVAVPAYAGIPVTQRGVAQDVTVISGHLPPGHPDSTVDWAGLGRGRGTVVVLMGVEHLAKIAAVLVEHGRPGDTPVAVVRWGTTPAQRTLVSTLDAVGLDAAGVRSPAVVVVGDVVALRERLAWWEDRPLSGLRVLVPRTRAMPSALAARLAALGAVPLEVPTVAVVPPPDPGPLHAALRAIAGGRATWLVLLSPAALDAVLRALRETGRDVRALARVRIAATGDGTVAALAAAGLVPDLVPEGYASARALAAAFPHGCGEVVVPVAEVDPAPLASAVAALGWTVRTPTAAVVTRPALPPHVAHALAAGDVHAVAFASSTSVRHLVEMAGPLPPHLLIAAMGRRTAAACAECELGVDVVPAVASVEALADALAQLVAAERAAASDSRTRSSTTSASPG